MTIPQVHPVGRYSACSSLGAHRRHACLFVRSKAKERVQLKAARLAEVLWDRRTADITDLASATASSSAATGVTHKSKLGRDIVEDYKTVRIGQSAYFTGAALSDSCTSHFCLELECMGTIRLSMSLRNTRTAALSVPEVCKRGLDSIKLLCVKLKELVFGWFYSIDVLL